MAESKATRVLTFWHAVTLRGLQDMNYDLSSRQSGILLTVYLQPQSHSIKSLAETLRISKPAVCRAIDALEKLKFVKRQRDKDDKRNVLILRTPKGATYLSEFAEIIAAVAKKNAA